VLQQIESGLWEVILKVFVGYDPQQELGKFLDYSLKLLDHTDEEVVPKWFTEGKRVLS